MRRLRVLMRNTKAKGTVRERPRIDVEGGGYSGGKAIKGLWVEDLGSEGGDEYGEGPNRSGRFGEELGDSLGSDSLVGCILVYFVVDGLVVILSPGFIRMPFSIIL